MTKLRADFHSHSHYSRDSVVSPRAFIDSCVRKGISCIAVTDHNEIDVVLADLGEARLRVAGDFDVVTLELEIPTDGRQNIRLVVDHEDRAARHRTEPTRCLADLTNVSSPFRFQP